MNFKYLFILGILAAFLSSCSTTKTNKNDYVSHFNFADDNSTSMTISLEKGKSYNHPTYAIWIESMDETFISTVFLTKSLATRQYGHGHTFGYIWGVDSGRSVRPASLPVWIHKAKIDLHTSKDLVDGISGATPTENTKVSSNINNDLPKKFRVLVEVNQPWDWNKYWTNSMYPESFEYKTSCQPSLVYAVTVNTETETTDYILNPIGHGHYEGKNGDLFTDLTTLTTAKEIFQQISLTINKK